MFKKWKAKTLLKSHQLEIHTGNISTAVSSDISMCIEMWCTYTPKHAYYSQRYGEWGSSCYIFGVKSQWCLKHRQTSNMLINCDTLTGVKHIGKWLTRRHGCIKTNPLSVQNPVFFIPVTRLGINPINVYASIFLKACSPRNSSTANCSWKPIKENTQPLRPGTQVEWI